MHGKIEDDLGDAGAGVVSGGSDLVGGDLDGDLDRRLEGDDGQDDAGHERYLLVVLGGTGLKTGSSVHAQRTKKPIDGYFWKEIHNNRL